MKKILLLLLIIPFFSACKSPPAAPYVTPPPPSIPVIPPAVVQAVINVIEPEFEIVSIVILQADLVNTDFETELRIINPNDFAVELSSIEYELHGNGMFWAEGSENDILHIPANSVCETKFRFSMNFINMNRRILDDVIRLRQVQYKFCGDVVVKAVIPGVPPFPMTFDCSGYSEVKQR